MNPRDVGASEQRNAHQKVTHIADYESVMAENRQAAATRDERRLRRAARAAGLLEEPMTGHTPWSEVRTPQPGDDLRKAIIDLCWKAAPNGEDEDGYVTHYVVASGYMHRLIGAAQGAGIPASFRVRCGHGWDQDAAEGYQCPVCLNPTLQRNDGQEAPDGH